MFAFAAFRRPKPRPAPTPVVNVIALDQDTTEKGRLVYKVRRDLQPRNAVSLDKLRAEKPGRTFIEYGSALAWVKKIAEHSPQNHIFLLMGFEAGIEGVDCD